MGSKYRRNNGFWFRRDVNLIGLSSRDEYNKNISLAVIVASAVVFIAPFIAAFGPENTRLVNSITGICFFVITLASIYVGRILSK